jgi:cyclopropane-fatty-acyl-phospholipid synthase
MSLKASIIPADRALPRADRERSTMSWTVRLARNLVTKQLSALAQGEITLVERGKRRHFGRPGSLLAVTVEVLNDHFWTETAFGGSVGAGEAYINGYWRCDNLTALVRIMVVNAELLSALEKGWAWLSTPVMRLLHFMSRNTKDGSRRNIAAHYDLGNELFALFLDETMAYSCGIFEHENATLYDASIAKFERICRRLELCPTDHLLEIGTGWGGLAIHAARHYGCRVTTTTISREQYTLAKEKIAAAGLADRIEVLLEDYRDLAGQYDKLVSVEMVEAVGHTYLDTYFGKCGALLKPNGMMLLQAITIRDQLYEAAVRSVDFIKRFIFPGSFIPSVSVLCASIQRATDMKVADLHSIGPHYATTLRRWREAFFSRLPEVKALGYSDAFVRLWEYYLCYCEGGFSERQLGGVQMLLTKPRAPRKALT